MDVRAPAHPHVIEITVSRAESRAVMEALYGTRSADISGLDFGTVVPWLWDNTSQEFELEPRLCTAQHQRADAIPMAFSFASETEAAAFRLACG